MILGNPVCRKNALSWFPGQSWTILVHGQILLERKNNRPDLSLLESSILYLINITTHWQFRPKWAEREFRQSSLSEPCPSWLFRGATSIVRVALWPSKDFWPLGRRTAMSKMWKFSEGATCNVIWQLALGHCQPSKNSKWEAWQKLGYVLKKWWDLFWGFFS